MDFLNHHTMQFIRNSITLTVYYEDVEASKVLTERELLTIMGYRGVIYNRESSLFCLACEVFARMDEEELLEFLDYTDEDWDYMWGYVCETYYTQPLNVVSCRKN